MPSNEPVKLERNPTKTTLRRTEPYKMLKTTTKALKTRVLIEEGLAKRSKKQHLKNTDKWHRCKAVVFHTVNHSGPLPLKELHSTGETIVWRDPGGILSLFTTSLRLCLKSHPRNANQNKTNTLTTIVRYNTAKENALKWTSLTGKEPYKNHSEKNRALQNVKKNNKSTKNKSSHRRRPS